ncbi:MAG: SpaA isopeptide-forming pilin-related protein [Myxococcota bacterium]
MKAIVLAVVSRLALVATGVLGVAAVSSASHAQSVVVTGPGVIGIGGDAEVTVTVNLPQGVYNDLQLDFLFPDPATYPATGFEADGAPADFTKGWVPPAVASRRYTHIGTLDLSTGAGVRTFKIRVYAGLYYTMTGTPFDYVGHLTGTLTDLDGNDHAIDTSGHAVLEATGNASIAFQYSSFPNIAVTAPGGEHGLIYTVYMQAGSLERILTGGPRRFTYQLGSALHYVRPNPTYTVNTTTEAGAPTPWTSSGGTISQITPYSERIESAVDLFIPCSAIPVTEGDSAYTVRVSFDDSTITWPNNVVPVHQEADITLPVAFSNQACGDGGGVYTEPHYLTSNGRAVWYRNYLYPPFGVDVVTDAMLVDVLPPDSSGAYTYVGPVPEDFETWGCNFPSNLFPSGQFSAADFLAERDQYCHQRVAAEYFVQDGDTHIVYYAATWGGGPKGIYGFQQDTYLGLAANWAANHGDVVANELYFNGDWGGGSHSLGDLDPATNSTATPPARDIWQADASLTVTWPTAADLYAGFSQVSTLFIDSNSGPGGFIANYGAYGTGLLPTNPTLQIDVPDGVIIDSAYAYNVYNCADYDDIHITAPASLSERPLVWHFGDAQHPYSGSCTPFVAVGFHLDHTYPFVHGESISFVNTVTAPGAISTYHNNIAAVSFYAIVAEGMDVKLTSSCWADGPDVPPSSAGTALYKVTAVNRGQQDLSAIDLTFHMPNDATFHAANIGSPAPDNGVLQVSTDGGSSWQTAPGANPAAVTDVRLHGFAIPGLGISAPRPFFYVAVDPTGTSGSISAQAVMKTFELGETPVKTTTFEVGQCPATLAVDKFFDADRSGTKNGEPALGAGFGFALQQNGATVASATTDALGHAAFADLAPGTYTLVETAMPSIQGTWVTPSPKTVVVGNAGAVSVDFGNACTCPESGDPCNQNVCQPDGSCVATATACDHTLTTHVFFAPGGAPLGGWQVAVHAGGNAGGPTVATGVTDGNGGFGASLPAGLYTIVVTDPGGFSPALTWTSTTGGNQQTVTLGASPLTVDFGESCGCDDGDACTLDSCAAPGVCSASPDPAAPPSCVGCGNGDPACQNGGWAFYVAVNGPNGASGVVKCTIQSGGSPNCDTAKILNTVCE